MAIFKGTYLYLVLLDKHIFNKTNIAITAEPIYNSSPTDGMDNINLTKEQYTKLETTLRQVSEDDLTVSKLSDFYASLFTAIAVIFAIIALLSWRSLNNKILESQQLINDTKKQNNDQIEELKQTLNNAIKEYGKLQGDVKLLRQKQIYAQWVQEKLDLEDIEMSFNWNFSIQDKTEIIKYYRNYAKEQEENVLVGISIAKYLMSEGIDKFGEVEGIYKVLEANTVLPDYSVVKPLLYHFLGQYQKIRYDNLKENSENVVKLKELLFNSRRYYNLSIKFSNEVRQERSKENLAVVLIELGKVYLKEFIMTQDNDKKVEAHNCFRDANKILLSEKKKDINTYWDQARIEFYTSEMIRNENVNSDLLRVIDKIKTKEESRIFVEKLRMEVKEFETLGRMGFPGDNDIIDSIEEKLKNKIFE